MNSSLDNGTLDGGTVVTTGITEYELFIQLSLFYIGFGILAGIGNVCIAGGIVRNHKQRSRFHIIVGFLAMARACLAFQFTLTAIFRFLRTFNIVSTFQTRITCHFIHFFLYNASTLELCLLCVLVLDRIFAIAASHTYHRWTCQQAKVLGMVITITVSILKFTPFYFGGHFHEMVKCLNVNSPGGPGFNAYNQHLDLVLAFALLLLYANLMLILRCHLRRLRNWRLNESMEESRAYLRKRTRLLPMLRTMIFVHCGFVLSSKIMLFLSGVLPKQAARLVAYGGALLMVDLVANVVILLWVNRDIQISSLAFLRRETACLSSVSGISRKKTLAAVW